MHLFARKVVFIFCFSALVLPAIAQDVVLSGRVLDAAVGTPLPGCTIFVQSANKGVAADEQGHYAITIPKGAHRVIFSLMGYRRDTVALFLTGSSQLDRKLQPESTTLSEVVVDAEVERSIRSTETGRIVLRQQDISKLPYLLGEVDPIRILQLMPGVQTSGEGSTGYYVRGGAVDQNLMLLDKSTVYNPSHLFGFFSIFNGSTVQDLELYKGGIPAHYGGRLSSVTRVNTRSGNDQQLKGQAGVGLVAANFLVEGPLKRGSSSFLIAGRRTYVDLFAKALRNAGVIRRNIDYYFYDLNFNADFKLSPRDKLSLRSYYGNDDFHFSRTSFSNDIDWRNTTASLTWKHSWDKLFSELSVQGSGYDMGLGTRVAEYVFDIRSNIRDVGFTYQFSYTKDAHDLTFGINHVRHAIRPNNVTAQSDDIPMNFGPRITLRADESAFFVNDEITLGDRLSMNAGVRLTTYAHLGAFTRYVEDDNFQIVDTLSYGRNETIKRYNNIEPRLSFRYLLTKESSVKISYDKSVQYMNMAPLSSVSLPLDVWVPGSSVIRPQIAHQVAAGYFKNFSSGQIETSGVVYYKQMYNQVEYREGVILGYSKGFNFDDNFVFGKGTSYGFEFSLKKQKGRINGQISYTLSKTTRQFDALNEGKPFAAKYDRLHDLSILANVEYDTRWTFSAVFVYGTGNALNLPVARYVIQEKVINEYGARNSFRMPAYHRLDLSATYSGRKHDKWQSFLVFSIYNVYSRRNPYYIYFETEGNLKDLELKTSIRQVSLFPIIPSLTYRIEF